MHSLSDLYKALSTDPNDIQTNVRTDTHILYPVLFVYKSYIVWDQ